jgi:hypothetical protein
VTERHCPPNRAAASAARIPNQPHRLRQALDAGASLGFANEEAVLSIALIRLWEAKIRRGLQPAIACQCA